MGISGIGIWQLLIILAIVVMLFGTKRLRSIGSDLGGAIKGFKKSMSDEDAEKEAGDKKDEPKNLDSKNAESAEASTQAKEKTEQK